MSLKSTSWPSNQLFHYSWFTLKGSLVLQQSPCSWWCSILFPRVFNHRKSLLGHHSTLWRHFLKFWQQNRTCYIITHYGIYCQFQLLWIVYNSSDFSHCKIHSRYMQDLDCMVICRCGNAMGTIQIPTNDWIRNFGIWYLMV